MLMHFEPVAATTQDTKTVSAVSATVIADEINVVAKPSQARSFVAKTDETWEWSDLRDYVVNQIEQRFGTFPRDFKKEAGIFKSFLARHGDVASAIARHAFEVENGYWAGAPISVNRFCKNSDKFFSDVITARLVDSPVAGW